MGVRSGAGPITVDLVDARSNELVWRGRADDVIPNDSDERAQKLQEAVSKMFENFPPPGTPQPER